MNATEVEEFLEHHGVKDQKLDTTNDDSFVNTIEVETFLKHYGVIGQKWGVRNRSSGSSGSSKSSDSSGSSKSSGDSGGSGGGGAGPKSAKAKTAHLSNDDLKKVIDRMRLDQQYADLTNPKKQSGKKYATKLLADSGNKLVGAAVAAVGTIAVGMLLGKTVAKSQVRNEAFKTSLKVTKAIPFPPPKFP